MLLFGAKMKFLTLIVSLSVAGIAHGQSHSIVGDWSTGEVLSQVGPSITNYRFTTNGSFIVATQFTQSRLPTLSATGTYHATTKWIIMIADSRTNAASYSFEEATLVIDEGEQNVFRLTKSK